MMMLKRTFDPELMINTNKLQAIYVGAWIDFYDFFKQNRKIQAKFQAEAEPTEPAKND